MRIAFVTTDDERVRKYDVDRERHEASFAGVGVRLEHEVWSDPGVDWAAFDLVVLRSPWDYSVRLAEFRAWLDVVRPLGTVRNPVPLIEWNLDKHYLAELADRGVAAVPTTFCASVEELVDALAAVTSAEVVVKPAISAGSRDTGRFAAGAPEAEALGRHIVGGGNVAIVSPAVSSVATKGETAVLLFDGVVSHAIRKGPLLASGGGLLGGEYREEIAAVEPDPATLALADAAHAAARAICAERGWTDEPLLYARFDVVEGDDGSPLLLEAELFEPSLFLQTSEGAADRFTEACLRRLG